MSNGRELCARCGQLLFAICQLHAQLHELHDYIKDMSQYEGL